MLLKDPAAANTTLPPNEATIMHPETCMHQLKRLQHHSLRPCLLDV